MPKSHATRYNNVKSHGNQRQSRPSLYREMNSMLENIRIILVRTFHPGNIGSTARAMKTMGLSDLYLVNPKDYPHSEADSLAAGALDLLQSATVVESIEEAVADCHLVVATSARPRSYQLPDKNARQAAQHIIQRTQQQQKIAILFGPERMGLHTEDIQYCQLHTYIPGNPDYNVLNIASAVQLISYELFMASEENTQPLNPRELNHPTQNELTDLYAHMQTSLMDLGFLRSKHPGESMQRMQQVFTKAQLEKHEVSMLRGLFSLIDKALQNKQ